MGIFRCNFGSKQPELLVFACLECIFSQDIWKKKRGLRPPHPAFWSRCSAEPHGRVSACRLSRQPISRISSRLADKLHHSEIILHGVKPESGLFSCRRPRQTNFFHIFCSYVSISNANFRTHVRHRKWVFFDAILAASSPNCLCLPA